MFTFATQNYSLVPLATEKIRNGHGIIAATRLSIFVTKRLRRDIRGHSSRPIGCPSRHYRKGEQMKRIAFALVLLLAVDVSAATYSEFLAALRQVETGSEPNGGRDSVGDSGRSKGPYQIGLAYFKDSGVAGTWDDVRDRAFAERVMFAYWKRYCPAALASNDFETLARTHNGGPKGAARNATLGYWRKVSALLD